MAVAEVLFNPDHREATLCVTLLGTVTGPQYTEAMIAALTGDPRLRFYDYFYDLTGYAGTVRHEDCALLAERFRRAPGCTRPENHAMLVSADPGMALWAKVMDLQFARRRFHAVPSMAAARALLARLRAEADAASGSAAAKSARCT